MSSKITLLILILLFPALSHASQDKPCVAKEWDRLIALRSISKSVMEAVGENEGWNWLEAFSPELAQKLPKAIEHDGVYVASSEKRIITSCTIGFNECGAISSSCSIEFTGANAKCVHSQCSL